MKVLTVIGTRPEDIKLAPVIRELMQRSVIYSSVHERQEEQMELQSVVCVTAQHRQMLDQVLDLFDIVPDYDLNVMGDNQTSSEVAAGVLTGLEPVLRIEQPDWVLVQGDTTTAALAALTAFYTRTKVAHVEAGLRTHDKWQPFPEEINRRVVGVIADLHFAPTQSACQNLLREGVADDSIVITGNPVIDALHWVTAQPPCLGELNVGGVNLERDELKLILVTAHRRENFGRPLKNICLALREIATQYNDRVHIIYPVHPNPHVWEPVHRWLNGMSNVTLIPPLSYPTLVHLMNRAYLVLTDSGGIQEEAPALGKPVLVLRRVTERPEAVEAGAVKLVGTNQRCIVEEAVRLLEDTAEYQRMTQAVNPHGDGQASRRIVAALLGEPVDPFGLEK
jgi:UDP-N-acetylglucosamine 2-epimerase (non-hydrolysing)